MLWAAFLSILQKIIRYKEAVAVAIITKNMS